MFEWDDANIERIGWHEVTPEEAEQAFTDRGRVPATAYRGRTGERRRAWIGATDEDRVLYVVSTLRGQRYRILMARDATEREYQAYVEGRKQ